MGKDAVAGRDMVGRLLLLLLLAVGITHLLAHAGAHRGDTGQAAAHAPIAQASHAAQVGEAPLLLVASAEDHHGDTDDLGVCAAVFGCSALLAAGARWLRVRGNDSLTVVRQSPAHGPDVSRSPSPVPVKRVPRSVVLRI